MVTGCALTLCLRVKAAPTLVPPADRALPLCFPILLAVYPTRNNCRLCWNSCPNVQAGSCLCCCCCRVSGVTCSTSAAKHKSSHLPLKASSWFDGPVVMT